MFAFAAAIALVGASFFAKDVDPSGYRYFSLLIDLLNAAGIRYSWRWYRRVKLQGSMWVNREDVPLLALSTGTPLERLFPPIISLLVTLMAVAVLMDGSHTPPNSRLCTAIMAGLVCLASACSWRHHREEQRALRQ